MAKRKRKGSGRRWIVGLMSGTSADGIDAVLAQIGNTAAGRLEARVTAHVQRPFAARLRQRILGAALHGSVSDICELNFELGECFAEAARAVIQAAGVTAKAVTAIGSHGQTIHHLPRAKTPSTLQIGEAAVIAERTGITTVADFRVGDMAAGGQGAPLVPYADWVLFADRHHPRLIQNLGGIGNLTFLPANARPSEVLAFDTGPANMVIDGVVTSLSSGRQTFDRQGRWAARGHVSRRLLAEMMKHPFLRRPPPKTTGREEFGEPFIQRIIKLGHQWKVADADIVASVTAFTAASVADAYRRFIFPRLPAARRSKLQVILGGGGAHNPVLRQALAAELPGVELLTHEDFGLGNQTKEALAFAIMAHETLLGRPSNVPSATGARRAVVLGKVIHAPRANGRVHC